MKFLVVVLLALCSIVWGKDVSLSSLSISEYVDTEISTNIVLGTAFENFRELNISISSNNSFSNRVEVSFGEDVSSDGILSSKEIKLAFRFTDTNVMCSYNDTNVFSFDTEYILTNAIINMIFLSDGNMQNFNLVLNGDTIVELPIPSITKDIMSQWNLMRVVRRGSSNPTEQVDVRIATDMTILMLK